MSDDLTVARECAREVVGESVWKKLSDTARTAGINEELRALRAKHATAPPIEPSTGTIPSRSLGAHTLR
jgi:hypothetical protein